MSVLGGSVLGRAVDCVLQQYEVLKSYFSSESMFELHSHIVMKWPKLTMGKSSKMHFIIVGESANRFAWLQNVFSAPVTELYLLFYQSALQVFLQFNMFLQRKDPLIPIIHKQMMSF